MSHGEPHAPLVGGRYRLLSLVREGSISEFWRAELHGACDLRRVVGLKRLRSQHANAPQFRDLFAREARILALMDHPNVVQLFDFAEDHRSLYMITEWVHGVSLADILWLCAAHRVLPSPVIVTAIGIEILRALEAAHSRLMRAPDGSIRATPILQRDLSPENVLLSVRGHVKLAEFGVARPLDPMALARMSPDSSRMSYIAPEIVAGRRPSPVSDLYACAALLWETICGRRLWGEEKGFGILAHLLEWHRPPSIRDVRPEVPREIADAIDRALSPDPSDRPPTAVAMVRALSAGLRVIPEVTDATRIAAEVAHAMTLRQQMLAASAQPPSAALDDNRPTLVIEPSDSKVKQRTRETLIPVDVEVERESHIPVEFDLTGSSKDDGASAAAPQRDSSDHIRDAHGSLEHELDEEILGGSKA